MTERFSPDHQEPEDIKARRIIKFGSHGLRVIIARNGMLPIPKDLDVELISEKQNITINADTPIGITSFIPTDVYDNPLNRRDAIAYAVCGIRDFVIFLKQAEKEGYEIPEVLLSPGVTSDGMAKFASSVGFEWTSGRDRIFVQTERLLAFASTDKFSTMANRAIELSKQKNPEIWEQQNQATVETMVLPDIGELLEKIGGSPFMNPEISELLERLESLANQDQGLTKREMVVIAAALVSAGCFGNQTIDNLFIGDYSHASMTALLAGLSTNVAICQYLNASLKRQIVMMDRLEGNSRPSGSDR